MIWLEVSVLLPSAMSVAPLAVVPVKMVRSSAVSSRTPFLRMFMAMHQVHLMRIHQRGRVMHSSWAIRHEELIQRVGTGQTLVFCSSVCIRTVGPLSKLFPSLSFFFFLISLVFLLDIWGFQYLLLRLLHWLTLMDPSLRTYMNRLMHIYRYRCMWYIYVYVKMHIIIERYFQFYELSSSLSNQLSNFPKYHCFRFLRNSVFS